MDLFHMAEKKRNGYIFAIFILDQGGYLEWLENCYWNKVQSQNEENIPVWCSQAPPVIMTP